MLDSVAIISPSQNSHGICLCFYNSPHVFCSSYLYIYFISSYQHSVVWGKILIWVPHLATWNGVGHIVHSIGIYSIKSFIFLLDSMGIKIVSLCPKETLLCSFTFWFECLPPTNWPTFIKVCCRESPVLWFSSSEMNPSFLNICSLTWFHLWHIIEWLAGDRYKLRLKDKAFLCVEGNWLTPKSSYDLGLITTLF